MKTNATESPERPGGRTNAVEITSYRPDFENPDHIPRNEAATIVREKLSGIWFINPIGKVHATCDSPEFLEAVLKRQADWCRHLSRQFKNGWREMRNRTPCSPPSWDGAYMFDGVIVAGPLVLPFEIWKVQRLRDSNIRTSGN